MFKITIAGFWMSLLFGGALVAAVFYQGYYTEFLCLTLTLLVLAALWVFWSGYSDGLQIPKSSVALALTLYWAWLLVAGSWGRVAFVGTINFWWLGSFPLVFWIYTLAPRRDELWRHAFHWAVLVGVALAIGASCQWLIYRLEPTATFLNRQSLAALLNLIAIPLAGYFLLGVGSPQKWRHWIVAAALFVLVFGMGLIEGRGATLSGGIGLSILVGVALWQRVSRRALAQLAAIVVSAFFIASQLGRIGIGQRMEALVGNPGEAGGGRFVIWKQSWELLKQAPWMGIGLGHYQLYFPPYRDPTDGSGGFFVHNDYLQIWIEAGLPGLLLLIAVLVSVFVIYLRAMRDRAITSAHKVEMTALFAALLAIAMHSFVDFNLYILSILIMAGLVLGRLQALALSPHPAAVFKVVPAKVMSRFGYRALTALIAAFALVYFSTLGLASFEYQRGLKLAEQENWVPAYTALDNAVRYFPSADNVLMTKADFVRHVITAVPESAPQQKKQLFDEAQELLDRAEDLNPFRPQTHAVRAALYEQNPTLAGPDWAEKVVRNYRRIIEIEPRAYLGRYLFANFLLKQGRRDEARQVLEGGMKYVYVDLPPIAPYLALTAKLRAEAGDQEGARAARLRVEAIEKVHWH